MNHAVVKPGFNSTEQRKNYVRRSQRIQMPIQSWCHRARDLQSRLVAEPVEGRTAEPALRQVRPDGRRLRLCEGVQEPRLRGVEERPRGADDQLTGLVASGLRALRAF